MTLTAFATALIAPVTSLISEAIEDKDKAAEIAYRVATMAAEHAHAECWHRSRSTKRKPPQARCSSVAGGRQWAGCVWRLWP